MMRQNPSVYNSLARPKPALRRVGYLAFAFGMVATLSFLLTRGMQLIGATSNSFDPGNIISDAVMADYNSMTKDEIQKFLTSKNPCNNRDYNYYLTLTARYPHLSWHWEDNHFVCLSEERFGDGVEIGKGQTAAEIIYQAAQDFKINPRVLLVLLEKEQSLVTDTYPNNIQYRSATGYGCPDTAACNTKYYGFKNQIRNAAELFRYTLDHGYSAYPENKPGVFVSYHPNSACGRSEVLIKNRATAALYRYTPYQPNQAALNAGFGTGDSCSSYGNRNFYLYFKKWFGDTQSPTTPAPVPPQGESTMKPTPAESDFSDGVYSLQPKRSPDSSLSISGNNIEISKDTSEPKTWQIKRDTDGFYTITDLDTLKVVASASENPVDGVNIQLQNPTNSCTEKWNLLITDDGYLTFESACKAGFVIDALNAGVNQGDNVHAWKTNNTDAQKWSYEKLGATFNEGTYTLASNLDSRFVVDASSHVFGANVHIWNKHYKYNQKWHIIYDAEKEAYQISTLSHGQVLTIGDEVKQGANVYAGKPTGKCGDYWQILDEGDGLYSFVSSCDQRYAIDVSAHAAAGVNLQIWRLNHTPAQRWSLSTETALGIADYYLRSGLSNNLALDISLGSVTSGPNVQTWYVNHTAYQRWHLVYDASAGHHTLTNPVTKKVLYVANKAQKAGDNVTVATPDGTCAQYWDVIDVSEGYSLVSACNPRMAIDVLNANTGWGTNVQVSPIVPNKAQKWQFAI